MSTSLTSLALRRCASCYKQLSRNWNVTISSRGPRLKYQVQQPRPGWFASQYSTNQKDAKPKADSEEGEEDLDSPYTYSTSKAAGWNVDKSFGSQYSRPWWKVAPVSIALCALVLWIFLRSETDLDKRLEITLQEHRPDLFPPTESNVGEEEESTSKNAG